MGNEGKAYCQNCEKLLSGNFCSNCGQKSSVSEITLSNLLNEFTESVFQFNSGFPFTVKELFKRPGKSIKDFLNGKKKNHFKPIGYVLLLSTVNFLITKATNQNTIVDDLISGFYSGANDSNEAIGMAKTIAWFANNYA